MSRKQLYSQFLVLLMIFDVPVADLTTENQRAFAKITHSEPNIKIYLQLKLNSYQLNCR